MALSQEANDQQRLFRYADDHRQQGIARQLASMVKLKGQEGKLGMVVRDFSISLWEAETSGSP